CLDSTEGSPCSPSPCAASTMSGRGGVPAAPTAIRIGGVMRTQLSLLVGLSFAATSIAQATEPAGKTELTWWGHAAWIVRTPAGTKLAIDPWLQNPKAPKDAEWPASLDAILVTHGHSDHVGNTIALLQK